MRTVVIRIDLPEGVEVDVDYEQKADPYPAKLAEMDDLPPVQTRTAVPFEGCPVHRVPWKVVPAGVSKKTGRPYDAFKACPEKGCDQRPH